MDHIYKQPKYFGKFRCIGGECPESCCDGWTVMWKPHEYDKLKEAGCPDDLKARINDSFEYKDDKDYYVISLCEDGRCPFHNRETDLCDIQKNIGENYLGIVCRRYPRHYVEAGNQLIRWCVTSCPAVIDLLFDDPEAMDLENVLARDHKKLDRSTIIVDTAEATRLDPVRRKRMELFDFYMGMLLDKSRDIETSIILTAIAVKHLTDAETKGNYNAFTKIISDMKAQLNTPAAVKSLEDLKPNYQLKFKLVNNMLVKFFGDNSQVINISELHDGNALIVERYLEGIDNFRKAFNNGDHVIKNVIMNTFYDMHMPLGNCKRTLFENYAYFVIGAAAIKTVAASVGYSSRNIREDFKVCVAEMSRGFSHDLKRCDAIIDDNIALGLNSPAHLAIIIKG